MLELFGKKSALDRILGRKSPAEKAVDGVIERFAKVGDIVVGTAEFISDAGSAIVESCKSDTKVVERTTTINHYHRPVVVEERKQPEVVVARVVVSPVKEGPHYKYTHVFLSRNHVWYYTGVRENEYGEYVLDVRRNSLSGRVVGTYIAYNFNLYLRMEKELGEKIRQGYFD